MGLANLIGTVHNCLSEENETSIKPTSFEFFLRVLRCALKYETLAFVVRMSMAVTCLFENSAGMNLYEYDLISLASERV